MSIYDQESPELLNTRNQLHLAKNRLDEVKLDQADLQNEYTNMFSQKKDDRIPIILTSILLFFYILLIIGYCVFCLGLYKISLSIAAASGVPAIFILLLISLFILLWKYNMKYGTSSYWILQANKRGLENLHFRRVMLEPKLRGLEKERKELEQTIQECIEKIMELEELQNITTY